jgi:serine/threonine-protein kinase
MDTHADEDSERDTIDVEPATEAVVGEVIGGYRLDARIGTGGMGDVFSATHTRLGRRAAVKLIRPSLANEPTVLARFHQEARIVNDVRHPNIVDIFDFVESDEPRRVACIMELLDGPSLQSVLKERELTAVQCLNVCVQLTDALRAVHKLGVVHRDLKPGNVIVVGPLDGDLSTVPSIKLLDFGIAKVPETQHTATGLLVGTPAYMSPEQIANDQPSSKSDVYAVGELLYETITRERLFRSAPAKILIEKISGQPPQIELPSFPGGDRIRSIILRCLAFDPESRPTTEELWIELRACLEAPPVAPRPRSTSLKPRAPASQLGARIDKRSSPSRRLLLGALMAAILTAAVSIALRGFVPEPVKHAASAIFPGRAANEPPAPPKPEEHPYQAMLADWKTRAAVSNKNAGELLAEARARRFNDTWKDYQLANELLERAVGLEPNNAIVLANHTENLASWKGEALTDEEAKRLGAVLEYADRLSAKESAVSRARAALALARGDLQACQRFAEEALDRDPGDGEARLLVAASHVHGQPERAIDEANESQRTLPQLRRRDLIVGRAMANGGHYAGAMRVVGERLRREPRNVAALMLMADFERELGHLRTAEAHYRQAIAGEGDRNLARLSLGTMLLASREAGSAEELFKAAAQDREAPVHYRVRANVGWSRAAVDRGRSKEAGPPLDAALSLSPHDTAARLLRAEILLEGGSDDPAERLARDILASQRGEPAALVILGRIAVHRRATDEAIGYLRDALMSDPHDAELRALLGAAYLEVGVDAQAFAMMEEAAKLDPLERTDNPRRAFFHAPPAAVDKALSRFELAAKGASRASANAAVALIEYQRGRSRQALVFLERALHVNPSDPLALVYGAQLAIDEGLLKEADGYIARLADRPEHAAIAHLLKARAQFRRGLYGEAKSEYDAAQKLDSSLALIFVERTLAEIKDGDKKAKQRRSIDVPPIVSARERLLQLEY